MLLEQRIQASPLYRYGIAIVAAAVALTLTASVWDVVSGSRFIFFTLAVVVSAWQGGIMAGMLCAAVSILSLDYLLIEPQFELIAKPTDILQFVIFGIVAFLIGWLEEQRRSSIDGMRQVKEELEVILNGVAEGISAQNEKGRIVFANQAAASLVHQQDKTALVGSYSLFSQLKGHYRIITEEDTTIDYDRPPGAQVFETGQQFEMVFGLQSLTTDERRWIQLRSSPVLDKNGNVRLVVKIFRDITASRLAEKHRIESEVRIRKILDNLSAFVGIMTPDGVLVEANRSALTAANLKPEDVLNKPFEEAYWWSYDAQIQQQLRDAIKRAAKGETVRYDVPVRVANGRIITIDFMLAPVFDGSGQVEFLIPSGIDVTARNELTQRLQMQQHRLEAILNSVPGIVYEGVGNLDTREQEMAFVSRYAETMLGYSMEEWDAVPNLWPKVVHPDDWDDAADLSDQTYQQQTNVPVPFRCITKDGRIIHAESYNNVLTDLNGNVIGTCGIVLDVTERRRQQAEINRLSMLINYERQRLANIISNVPGIVFEGGSAESDNQGMAFISAYIERLLGYTPQEAMLEGFWEKVVHPDDWDSAVKGMEEIYNTGQAGKLQFRCITKSGQVVHLETHSSVIVDEAGKATGAVGVMTDISERKQIEEALTQYAEDLQRSNEELEQFAYVASHDLQEPLRMVTSYLQLIEKRYTDHLDDDAREFIGYAVDGATRMKTLINDLLAYSRIQRGKMEAEPVKLEEALDQALYNLQLAIEDEKAVITHDPLPEVIANRAQMTQLLQNLIGNAIKFRSERPPEIHVGVKREGKMWHFTVSDNGIGIDSEYFERIFVIFQRLHTRGQYKGTGIGLAICKKIVDKHGGRIYAESTPNVGTTFHFTLPVERIEKRHGRSIHGSN